MNSSVRPERTIRLDQVPVEYELCLSLSWMCRLRWLAGAGVIVAAWFTGTVLGLGVNPLPLILIGVAVLAYNLVFQRWLTRIECSLTGISRRARTLAQAQIAADWIAMALLIHFSGGVESPVILYFFFHTTLAALLLSTRDTFALTTLAIGLVTAVALLEYAGVLPHHHVEGLLPFELYANPAYVAAILFFFASALLISSYLATRVTRRLRGWERDMVRLAQDLQRAYDRLEALTQGAQAVSSTLALQEVLDRLTRSTTEVMNVTGCTIQLLQETSTELCLASTYGLSDAYVQNGCLLVDQNPLVRQVLSGEVVSIPDVTADPRVHTDAEAQTESVRSTLIAPLSGKTGPLGIIRVYGHRVHRFAEEDAQFLRTVASHGSIAIENAMAYEAIRHLEEAKRKFVLMVTHELRSPLGVVRSLLNTLAGGYAGRLSDLQADMIGRALRRADFLQTLIDDMLDLAAGKAGLRVSAGTEPIDLAPLVQGILERYRVPAEEKRISLRLEIAQPTDQGTPPVVSANREELDRAITNLVSNALKYTPEGGTVTLTLARDQQRAVLTVSDTGIGIPEEALPHLFEEFYRAPNAKAQVKQGTGLGLVITKDIVTRYGGSISVKSAAGRGTTFTVILPLADQG